MNFVVDPFGLRGGWHMQAQRECCAVPIGQQLNAASNANSRLYLLAAFNRAPQPVLLLGDSRALMYDEPLRKRGVPLGNLAYGSGSLYEAIDSFWFASNRIRLAAVIISVPFNLYSETNTRNLVASAKGMISNPFAYYESFFVFRFSLRVLNGRTAVKRGAPLDEAAKNAFWDYQLGPTTDAYYSIWTAPRSLLNDLEKIRDYCRAQNIRLIAVIPPTHVDLQRRVAKFGLGDDYDRYKAQLRTLADTVIDFDVPNVTTMDRENFLDPYHIKPEYASAGADSIAAILAALRQER